MCNQRIHGATTCNGHINYCQVEDAASFMAHFVPVVIKIMRDHPWGLPLLPGNQIKQTGS